MNSKKLVESTKSGAINHVLPAIGGVVVGQFLGEHRLLVGGAATVLALAYNQPQIATAAAVAAVTPVLPTGTSGISTDKGQARTKAYMAQLKSALWPFEDKKEADKKAAQVPATTGSGTSGLGDTYYTDYDTIDGVGATADDQGAVLLGAGNYGHDELDNPVSGLASLNAIL